MTATETFEVIWSGRRGEYLNPPTGEAEVTMHADRDHVPPVDAPAPSSAPAPKTKRQPNGRFASSPSKTSTPKKRPAPATRPSVAPAPALEPRTLALQRILQRSLVVGALLEHHGTLSPRFAQSPTTFMQAVSELVADITEAARTALTEVKPTPPPTRQPWL